MGVLFPSSMPESELEVLVEVWLGSASTVASLPTLSSGCFEGTFCLGKGTGTMPETGCSSVGVSSAVPFLGKGEGVGVVGLSGDCSPSKLV